MALATSLLGTHVCGSSRDPCTTAEILFFEHQSKVAYVGLTRTLNQDIGWLDVTMNQPSCVSVMQRVGNRGNQFR